MFRKAPILMLIFSGKDEYERLLTVNQCKRWDYVDISRLVQRLKLFGKPQRFALVSGQSILYKFNRCHFNR